jgi:ketopantoate reductase
MRIIFCSLLLQLEKHIWICAFMAIGAKYRCTVGEVEKKYDESVRMLINELARTVTKVSQNETYKTLVESTQLKPRVESTNCEMFNFQQYSVFPRKLVSSFP